MVIGDERIDPALIIGTSRHSPFLRYERGGGVRLGQQASARMVFGERPDKPRLC